MFDINFETITRAEALVERINSRLQNYTRFWTDFVIPFTYGEIDDIFDTGGRGAWADLDPLYAARKRLRVRGKGCFGVTTITSKRQRRRRIRAVLLK